MDSLLIIALTIFHDSNPVCGYEIWKKVTLSVNKYLADVITNKGILHSLRMMVEINSKVIDV